MNSSSSVAPVSTLATCTPRGDRVVVRIDAVVELKSPGGILIVDRAPQRPSTGTVVSIGPGRLDANGYRQPIEDIRVGDRVLYTPFAGMSLDSTATRDGDHLLLREDDIVAVLGG